MKRHAAGFGTETAYVEAVAPLKTMLNALATTLLLAVGCTDAPILVGLDDTPGHRSQAIVNGQLDPSRPAVGLLLSEFPNNKAGLCTASLVGPKTVLTAAHCVVYDKQPPIQTLASNATFVINGTYKAGVVTGTKYPVASYDYHPSYSPGATAVADVAVLRLATAVQDVQPIRVAKGPTYQGEQVILVGYGRTGKDKSDSGEKRSAKNTVEELNSSQFTYKGALGGEGCTCSGDSGSPVLAPRNGEEVQVGVHSAGTCAVSDDPNTITGYSGRADIFYGWIEGAAQGDLYKGGPVDTSPPKIAILQPAADSQVTPGFEVRASVQDDGVIKAVQLLVDGQPAGELGQPPFEFKVADLSQGSHQIRVEAEDKVGHRSSAVATVTVIQPKLFGTPCTGNSECESGRCVSGPDQSYCSRGCSTATDCPTGFDCVGAVCVAKDGGLAPGSPSNGAFGQPCDGPQDCVSGLCARNPATGVNFCTATCSVEQSDCPGATVCHATSPMPLCGPLNEPPGLGPQGDGALVGACNMTAPRPGRPGGPSVTCLLLLLALGLLPRRRP
jgi:V8-like Glu-specific endopeptidase